MKGTLCEARHFKVLNHLLTYALLGPLSFSSTLNKNNSIGAHSTILNNVNNFIFLEGGGTPFVVKAESVSYASNLRFSYKNRHERIN